MFKLISQLTVRELFYLFRAIERAISVNGQYLKALIEAIQAQRTDDPLAGYDQHIVVTLADGSTALLAVQKEVNILDTTELQAEVKDGSNAVVETIKTELSPLTQAVEGLLAAQEEADDPLAGYDQHIVVTLADGSTALLAVQKEVNILDTTELQAEVKEGSAAIVQAINSPPDTSQLQAEVKSGSDAIVEVIKTALTPLTQAVQELLLAHHRHSTHFVLNAANLNKVVLPIDGANGVDIYGIVLLSGADVKIELRWDGQTVPIQLPDSQFVQQSRTPLISSGAGGVTIAATSTQPDWVASGFIIHS